MTGCRARRAPGAALLAAGLFASVLVGQVSVASAQSGPLRLEPPGSAPSAVPAGSQAVPQSVPQAGPGLRAAPADAVPAATGWPFGPGPAGAAPRHLAATPTAIQNVAPQPAIGAPAVPVQGRPPGPGGGSGPAGGVTVTRLGALDVDFGGTLGDRAGGFGTDLWRGSTRQTVAILIPALPTGAISPAGRDLLRRLLLSSAEAPEPVNDAAPRGVILTARLGRLAAMGERRGLDELLQSTASLKTEPLARLRADQALLRNDASAACNQARDSGAGQNDRTGDDRYWAEINVFCRALAGEHERAALAAQLLRETGTAPADQAFDVLVRAMRGDISEPLASLKDPTPLTLAMLRAARQPIPGDIMAKPQAGDMLVALAGSPNATLETRLAAAERAVALGAMAGESLSQIYVSVPHTPADIADALARAPTLGGAKGRSLLHRAIETQSDLVERVKLLRAALVPGNDRVGYLAAIRANLAAIEAIPPTAAFIAAAPDFVRALLYARRFESARRWLSLVARAPAGEAGEEARLALWPYAALDSGRGATGEALSGAAAISPDNFDGWFAAWRKREVAQDAARAGARTALVQGLLQSFGYPVDAAIWPTLLKPPYTTTGPVPSLALTQALQAAEAGGRTGETLLLGLIMLGDGGIAEAGPGVALSVIEALRGISLEAEARQLAIEALVAAGL